MFQATMRCHLWDLVDERIDDVLDRLKGEAGITGISVPLVCPPVEQLRPHKGVSPRTFRSRGGIQFQPRAEFYANTRLRPVVAEWLRKSNPLPQVAEACAKRGLTLRGEINCCHAPVMVEKYPFAAVKDVFGEVNPEWMCPVNPDVREYLKATILDLHQSYSLEEVALYGLEWPHLAMKYEWERQDEPKDGDYPLARWLLGICFCESCRQGSPLSKEASRTTESAIAAAFESGAPLFNPVEQMEKWPALEPYCKWQNETLVYSCLVDTHQFRRETSERITRVIGTCFASAVPARRFELGRIWRFGESDDFDLEADQMIESHPSRLRDAATLVRVVSDLSTEHAVNRVTFHHYGELPLSRLAWIKQAVRYAQRQSG